MKAKHGRNLGALAIGLGVIGMLSIAAGGTPETASARADKYIGASKCKNCHQAAESGNQYAAWENAKHSKAFETLASDEAKAIAAEKGIADPQKAEECLKCHTTGHGIDAKMIKRGFKAEAGVQCESCHGPGDEHMKARFAAAAKAGEGEPEAPPPGEMVNPVTQDVCLQCHNSESPTFEKFCYHEMAAKIRHINPKLHSADDMLVCGCGDECPCTDGCPDDGCGVPKGQ